MEIPISDPDQQLYPLTAAIRAVIPGDHNPAKCQRWSKKGILFPDGTRCLIRVWYVGRAPHTTLAAVKEWVEAVTAARQSKSIGESEPVDVTEAELRAAGLISD